MCTITKELKKPKTGTGYKLVIKHKNGFYSPSTGIKYTVGMDIPHLSHREEMIDGKWASPFDYRYYEKRMQGNTGIFVKQKDLFGAGMSFSSNYHYSVIRIKLGRVLYHGRLDGDEVYVGDDVMEITELYTTIKKTNGYVNRKKLNRVKQ